MTATKQASLAVENGLVIHGVSVGADGESSGDLVFNTAMSGYHEILTDPSYAGQSVVMTYPLIGNYGINLEDVESGGLSLRGFIVKELCFINAYYVTSISQNGNICGCRNRSRSNSIVVVRDYFFLIIPSINNGFKNFYSLLCKLSSFQTSN